MHARLTRAPPAAPLTRQVIGGNYSHITLARLAQMLDLTPDEVRAGLGWAGLGCAQGRSVPLPPRRAAPASPPSLPPTPPAPTQAEKQLSDLVVSGALAAKVDRPAGIIRFSHRK